MERNVSYYDSITELKIKNEKTTKTFNIGDKVIVYNKEYKVEHTYIGYHNKLLVIVKEIS